MVAYMFNACEYILNREILIYLELIGTFLSSSVYDCVDMSSKLGSVVFGSLGLLGVENELKFS